jgi:type I restriction enzyme S subunit
MTTIPWLGPVHFPVGSARHAFDITLGKMFQASPSSPSDIEVPYFKSVSVQWRGVQTNHEIRMWATPAERRDLAVRPDDLLICEGGDVGRSAIYDGPDGFIFEKSVHRARPVGNSSTRYLWYVLHALHSSDWLDVLCNKATIRHLTGEKLGALEIPIPPAGDQRRIADFLDAETARIDNLVGKRRRMRDLLALKRERVIESVLGLERGNGSHALVPLKYMVEGVSVGIVITPAKWYVDSGGTPALRGLNVKPGSINSGDLVHISAEGHAEHVKSRLEAGDVIVVRTGQAGAAAVVPPEFDGANCIDLIIIRPGRKVAPKYLEYVLNSEHARAQISEHAVGSIQAHFNVGAMKQIPVPALPRDAQEDTVVQLDQIVEKLDRLQEKLAKQVLLLTERRQALITAAVTGQFDVSTASGRNVTEGAAV